jgi:hypothetical protein
LVQFIFVFLVSVGVIIAFIGDKLFGTEDRCEEKELKMDKRGVNGINEISKKQEKAENSQKRKIKK